jgi:hypothetical protein
METKQYRFVAASLHNNIQQSPPLAKVSVETLLTALNGDCSFKDQKISRPPCV